MPLYQITTSVFKKKHTGKISEKFAWKLDLDIERF